MIELQNITFPDFGFAAEFPSLAPDEHQRRVTATIDRMKARAIDFLVVYGDREHFANLTYLCGYDPRFEEGLFLLDRAGKSLLLVGNEGMGYLPPILPNMAARLFQEFSLLGQPRGTGSTLRDIMRGFGIRDGSRVGCVGWKYFNGNHVEGGEQAIELPAYMVDLLRDLAGGRERVVNATDIFMGVEDGLRLTCSAAEIAQFEFAATRSSRGVWNVIRHIREGVTERELSHHLQADGLPLACHSMVSTGEKAKRGLESPSDRRVKVGDAFTTALGLWGSLTARAGFVARGPEDVPATVRDNYAAMSKNYFDVMVAWYESVRVGATGGEVFAAVDARRDAKGWEFALNPGHHIHLDEWVHSPFFQGSNIALRSGAAIQLDIIPVARGPFWGINGEDGVALADATLREELAQRFPECWSRIDARQSFMRKELGIRIYESLLPLSDAPALLAPYLLSPNRVYVQR